ncbi:MAG: DNA alkylation repair protein [Legionella sp.]|nr:DNA alkylation repair protein [Legionella sp.]
MKVDRVAELKKLVHAQVKDAPADKPVFFKTGPGDYAEHDQFIGVSVPNIRKIAKQYRSLSRTELNTLISSPINEERLLALFILVDQYQRESVPIKSELYQFYLDNIKQVNNWNLVDASAYLIMGAHLVHADKTILINLAHSDALWERRIAIVSTWYFIRQNDLQWTMSIAKILLHDKHDLIHKAVGWMLREAGKKDLLLLVAFLNEYAHQMPRTMLRYAIEKFTPEERKVFLMQKS